MHATCCYLFLLVVAIVFLAFLRVGIALLILYKKDRYPWKSNVMDSIEYPKGSFQPTGKAAKLTPEEQLRWEVFLKCLDGKSP